MCGVFNLLTQSIESEREYENKEVRKGHGAECGYGRINYFKIAIKSCGLKHEALNSFYRI